MNARNTLITLCAVAVAVALVAVAPAAAAPKPARFVAHIQGKQVTTWKEPRWKGNSDCQGQRYQEGGGTETVRFKSKKPFRLTAVRLGRTVDVMYGTWRKLDYSRSFGIPTPGTITRNASIVHSIEPGYCFGGGPTQSDTGPYDCRTLRRPDWETRLSWYGSRLEVEVLDTGSFLPGGDRDWFDNCPMIVPFDADEGEITTISQRYPVRDLFDRSQGLVEVLGRKRFEYEDQFRHATTNVTWKLRLRRVR
jgi:hypothetical protein